MSTGSTESILDTLARYGRRATFFVVGRSVQANPWLVQREVNEGHRVGNHTWDHPYLTQLTTAEVRSELTQASDAIEAATGTRPTEWRPPYGDWNSTVRSTASSVGLPTMTLWDTATDSNDWKGGTPQEIADRVVTNAFDGATVLMHDRIDNTAIALPLILDGLNSRGFCTT